MIFFRSFSNNQAPFNKHTSRNAHTHNRDLNQTIPKKKKALIYVHKCNNTVTTSTSLINESDKAYCIIQFTSTLFSKHVLRVEIK